MRWNLGAQPRNRTDPCRQGRQNSGRNSEEEDLEKDREPERQGEGREAEEQKQGLGKMNLT